MKTNYFTIFFLTCGVCCGQNLVPNGDFEQYSACPTGYEQINLATPWFSPTSGTPDYFNACAGSANWSVPYNGMGPHGAHSGQAYAGIVLYDSININAREYIEVPLSSSLTAGGIYHFEMFASKGPRSYFRTDAIQAYFSDTLITGVNSTQVLPFTPHISNASGNFLNNSTWSQVSGNYIAHGGESFLLIGNFKDDASTAVIGGGSNFSVAYTYIEDVSVTIVTGINQPEETVSANLFPNPFNDNLWVDASSSEPLQIVLYDIASRKILQQEFIKSVSLIMPAFESGLYIYEIRNKNGVMKQGKIIKQ